MRAEMIKPDTAPYLDSSKNGCSAATLSARSPSSGYQGRMLKDGIIEESTSPWSSPTMVVPKPNSSLQLCNDFQKVYEVSKFDSYPMLEVG